MQTIFDWCLQLGLAEATRTTIASARSRNPTRRVGGGRQNVSGRYPSRKMGVTIQFESHRVELPFVYEMEHDPAVLEYYDQLHQFHSPILRRAEDGCRSCILRLFVLSPRLSLDGLSAKTEGDLETTGPCKSPHRLRRSGGCWQLALPAGEAHASALGLGLTGYGHRIKSIGTFSVTCNSSTIISDAILGTQRSPSMPQSNDESKQSRE